MYTLEKQTSITRKAPIGITKGVGLDPYEGDMAFYSNHDLVQRAIRSGQGATPNPYNKEEHISFYKVSFTIDAQRLGKDEWIVNEQPHFNNNELKIKLPDGKEKTIPNVQESNTNEYKVKNGTIKIEQVGNKHRVIFELDENEKKKRICDILNAIKNGLYAQSSGEANTLVPLFIIAGIVKVPSPVFHPFIDVILNDNNKLEIIGICDGLENDWVEKVFIQVSQRFYINENQLNKKEKIVNDWNEFIKQAGLACNEKQS
jgi:CRISPR-associated protein Cst2